MALSSQLAANAAIADHDDWLTPRRFIVLLAVLTLAAYPQILLGLQTFVFRDFGFFAYPIAYHWRESFWRGEIPLWNPLSYCGLPFLAEWNTQVLYPPALFYLLFPLSWSLGVFCLLHLFLGGWGMYFLAHRWTQNRFAAAFAGIVFAFNGLTLNSLIWPATIPGLGWMPWVVWLTERAWREGGRTVFIAVLVGALQLLSGAVEVVLLTWGLLGALGLTQLIRGELRRVTVLRRAVLVVLLISGLCAAQLLPFFDLLRHSHRQEDFHVMQWPMPKTGWLNFLVPLFHCRSDKGVFMQDNQYWTSSYYVGVTTVALALWALWRVRCRHVWLLFTLTGFCLVLALGDATPVYGWLSRHVGAIGLMRFPIKFVILPVFALPLLAAYGLAEREQVREVIPFNRQWLQICFAIGVLIPGIIWWNCRVQPPDDARSAMLFNGLARVIFFAAIVAGLSIAKKISNVRLLRSVQLLLLLLVWLDLYRHTPLPPTVRRAIYTPHLRHSESTPRLGVARAVVPPSARDQFISTFLPDPTEEYISRRLALFLNCNLLDDVPKDDGFFPLYLHEQAALFYNDLPDPMLDFIGASQVLVVQTNTFFWKPRPTFLPLLTGGQKPVFTNDEATLQILASADFNPRQEVYLPLAAKKSVTATNSTAVKILSAQFSAHRIEAKVEAAAPAILVAAQMYYHPWRAYVDGRPTPLWRANYGFQALEVPAGSHRVKLVYEDRRFYLGVVISLATLTGCLGFYCCLRRSTRCELPTSC
jgi:hypothetical protein